MEVAVVSKIAKENKAQQYYNYASNAKLSYIPDDLHYVLVLPFSSAQSLKQENFNAIPYVITYRENTTKVSTIIKELLTMTDQFQGKNVGLTLQSGYRVPNFKSMRDLFKELGKSSFENLTFFVQDQNEASFSQVNQENVEISEEEEYQDECSVMDYMQQMVEFGHKQPFKVWVEIQSGNNKGDIFTLVVNPELNGSNLIKEVIKAVQLNYNFQLEENMIKSLKIKESGHEVNQEVQVLKQTIYDGSFLMLQLTNPNLKLRRVSTKDYKSFLIVFKEGEKEPKKYTYTDISEMTFGEFYKNFELELKESKKKRDVIYGLQIMNIIIKNEDKLSLAEAYFNTHDPTNVVGKVITDKMVFYKMIPELANKLEFSLDELDIPPNQKEKRKKCRELSTLRAAKATNEYFQNKEHLEPILVYTAELKYNDKDGKAYIIYESLNRFLRQSRLLTLDEGKIVDEWRYKYAGTLLKHLAKIEPYEGIVYRGINYDPKIDNVANQEKGETGDILTFKSFLSTSKKKATAESFAKTQTGGKKRYMFQLHIKKGYPIMNYSEYLGEEQVLLPPFRNFEVIQQKKSEQGTFTLITYVLKQLETEQEMPPILANFIVWIDDNPRQGKEIYDQIDITRQTTMLVQLLSTQDLKQWLQKHHQLFTDKTANLIFISDLTRKEGGVWNQIAGIQGLREIHKYDEKAEIFFYIGNKAKAREKCQKNGVYMAKVTIGDHPKQIASFINRKLQLQNS